MKTNKLLFIGILVTAVITSGLFAYYFVYLPNKTTSNVGGCSPTKFRQEKNGEEYFLFWTTLDECTGYVKYGNTAEAFPYLAVDQQGVVKVREHEVKLSGITKGSTYYFVIFSNEKSFGNEGRPLILSFE